MPRKYTINLAPTTYTTTCDLLTALPATNKVICVVALRVYQTLRFGDAHEEILTIGLVIGNTSAGSGGGTVTPQRNPNDSAAAFTARAGDSTIASSGTTYVPYRDGWNVRSPMSYIWTPETWNGNWCSAAETQIALRLIDTPAESLTIGASMDILEVP